jgi:ferric-dicitrate binding protein FerR (iron transport regulator)
MTEEEVWELMVKSHQLSIAEHESERLDAWIRENQANRLLADGMAKLLSQTDIHQEPSNYNAKIAWAKVEGRVTANSKVRYFTPTLFRWAAAIMIIGLISVAYWQLGELSLAKKKITVSTKSGESKKIVLGDSTQLWLNENSILTYSREFDDDTVRLVQLNGEAFLEVAHDQEKPFIVSGKNYETRVLGTSFNVQLSEKENSVVVVTGKVRFSHKKNGEIGSSVVIEKGFQATANQDHELTLSPTTNQNKLAWHTRTLEFRNQRITDVITELSSYYRVVIKIKVDKPQDYLFTGTIHQASAETALETICYSLHLRWKKTTRGYLIFNE